MDTTTPNNPQNTSNPSSRPGSPTPSGSPTPPPYSRPAGSPTPRPSGAAPGAQPGNTVIPGTGSPRQANSSFYQRPEPRTVQPPKPQNEPYAGTQAHNASRQNPPRQAAQGQPSPVRPSSLRNPQNPQMNIPHNMRPAQTPPPEVPATPKGKGSRNGLVAIIIILLVLVLGLGAWLAISTIQNNQEVKAEREAREAAELTLQQDLANSEFESLEKEFDGLENPRDMIASDSVKLRLTEKYEAARLEVENLQRQLKETKSMSAKEIADLRAQIATLRALLKHYIEEIDRLNKENEALRTENAEIKDRNEKLSNQVEQTSRENKHLSERMTLAEKLNVTGVTLTALNKKGKTENKVKKAVQLMVSFTIPQNNSTPVGEKTIYVRITTPEGQLLEGGGSFSFEGSNLSCSAKRTIEYGGQEIGGLKIYYDVRSALNPGTYSVELFADNYRLASKSFTLK